MTLSTYEAAAHIDEKGRLVLQEPDHFKRVMQQFGRGLAVTVRVDERRDTRSSQANRYYFGVILALISEHTGYEKDELHEFFKRKFNPTTVSLGDELEIGGSTRKMNTKQFSEYIERIRRFAEVELGVTTPEAA